MHIGIRMPLMPKPITREQLSCENCGESFEAHAYRADKAKYCSRECYREHRFRKEGACPSCGGAPPRGRRFCSRECWAGHWNRREGERYESRKAKYKARQQAIIAALGGKCIECGISDLRVLEIDHIDPAIKQRPKHRQYPLNVRVVLWEKEMGNLQVLCANCHRIKTHEQTWAR